MSAHSYCRNRHLEIGIHNNNNNNTTSSNTNLRVSLNMELTNGSIAVAKLLLTVGSAVSSYASLYPFGDSSNPRLVYFLPSSAGSHSPYVMCCIDAVTIFLASWNARSSSQCGLITARSPATRLCSLIHSVCMAVR